MMESKTSHIKQNKSRTRQRGRKRDATPKASKGSAVSFGNRPSDSSFVNTFVPAFKGTSVTTQLRYGAATLNFTALTASVGRYVFTANGLFDPNITGGALAPAGFSQLMLSYNHYLVTHARITVLFTNNSTTPTMVGIAMDGDSTGTSDPSNLLELPKEQLVALNGASLDGSQKTITLSVNTAKYYGTDIMADPTFRGDVASNPTEQVYFHCVCFSVKGGTCDVFMQVKIDYTAKFFEPRELSPSLQKMIMLSLQDEARSSKRAQGTTGDFTVV